MRRKETPPNPQIYARGNQVWDAPNVVLLADGSFDFRGVRTESIPFGVHLPHCRLSERDKSLDKLNGGSIVGCVQRDTYIELLLEPGNCERWCARRN